MKKILKYYQGSKTTNTTKSSTIQVDGENSEDTSGNPSRGSIKNTGSNASASGDIGWITGVSSSLNGVDNAINPGVQNSTLTTGIFGGMSAVSSAIGIINPVAGAIAESVTSGLKLINDVGGKSISYLKYNNDVSNIRGSYGTFNKALANQGKKFGLLDTMFGKEYSKERKQFNKVQSEIPVMEQIAANSLDDKQRQLQMSDLNNEAYQVSLSGGYKPLRVGKHGMTMHSIISANEQSYTEEYKSGGSIQQNVIPEGALHARLNHMENDNITSKGIPVVSMSKGSQVQQAEIECNEIIFNTDTTTKIEEYYKKGDDESAILCGKLLAEQIMENTDDRTNLINTVK